MSNITVSDNWDATIKAVQLTDIVLAVICSWLLISSIFWGTKDKRWIRTPSKSSFNSGIIFITYILTTGLLLAGIILSLVHMKLSAGGADSPLCRGVLESTSVLGYSITYGTYLFVWIQQRRIFLHPCIKDQVSTPVKALNIAFLVACSATFVLLISFHFINPEGMYGKYTCYENESGSMPFTIGTTVAICAVHVLMLSLSLYPAFQESVQTSTDDPPRDDAVETMNPNLEKHSYFTTFYRNIKLSRKMMLSPINVTIRRVVYGTSVIFFSDLIGGIAMLIIPNNVPTGVRKLPQNVTDLVGILGMLIMLGFFSKVVTFFVPIRSVHIPKVALRTKSVRQTTKHANVPT